MSKYEFSLHDLRACVVAYDKARCAAHGDNYETRGMSETNMNSIAPFIYAAIEKAAYESGWPLIPSLELQTKFKVAS
jgi:hypothetical protein